MKRVAVVLGSVIVVVAAFLMLGCSVQAEKPAPQEANAAPAVQPAQQPAQPQPAPVAVSLSKDVMPIFARTCATCHFRGGKSPAVKDKTYFETKKDILGRVGMIITP